MANIHSIEKLFKGIKAAQTDLGDIILLDDLQQRQSTDKDAVEGYCEAMKANGVKDWEPIKLVRLIESHTLLDGSELAEGALLLVDGFQRTEAATDANHSKFPAQIADATFDDAVKYSLVANKYNGVSLKGKDFQKAIKRLYLLDSSWREHGQKKELALLFGCSEKTVQRAVAAIDKEIKSQAFDMFSQGATDKEVSEFSFKSLETIKRWREEYNEEQAKKEEQATQDEQASEEENNGNVDILTLTIESALKVTDPQIQAAILSILGDAFGAPKESKKTKAEPQDDEPPFDADEPQVTGHANDVPSQMAASWEGKTAWEILGITQEKMDGYKQKKAQLQRAYTKVLRKIHPDKFGNTKALELLLNAQAEIKAFYKIK